jgi:hypothetical protein
MLHHLGKMGVLSFLPVVHHHPMPETGNDWQIF